MKNTNKEGQIKASYVHLLYTQFNQRKNWADVFLHAYMYSLRGGRIV